MPLFKRIPTRPKREPFQTPAIKKPENTHARYESIQSLKGPSAVSEQKGSSNFALNKIISWQSGSTTTVFDPSAIKTDSSGSWVIVGYDEDYYAAIALSTDDGETWNIVYSDLDGDKTLYDVAYGDGAWVAVGEAGSWRSVAAVAVTSSDGINWGAAEYNIGVPAFGTVCYGNDGFVAGAGSQIFHSTDNGATWTSRYDTGDPDDHVATDSYYFDGQYLVLGYYQNSLIYGAPALSSMYYSENAIDWEMAGTGGSYSERVYSDGSNWFLIGSKKPLVDLRYDTVIRGKPSADSEGEDFTSALPRNEDIHAIAHYRDDGWYMFGKTGIWNSRDATTWTFYSGSCVSVEHVGAYMIDVAVSEDGHWVAINNWGEIFRAIRG